MLGAAKVLQGRHRIRESFMGSPRVGAGSSEVEAAEGTTREQSKTCRLPVRVVQHCDLQPGGYRWVEPLLSNQTMG